MSSSFSFGGKSSRPGGRPPQSVSSPSPASARQEEQSYIVLYYKRKNKIHKAKGVAKIDGVLTVVPQKSIVTLKNEADEGVVFHGIQKEISKKGALEVDETIQLGAYEVEVIGVVSRSAPPLKKSTARAIHTAHTLRTNTNVVALNKGSSLSLPGGSKDTSSHPKRSFCSASSIPSSTDTMPPSASTQKRRFVRKPPAQPVKKARTCEDETEKGSSSDEGQEPPPASLATLTVASAHKENTIRPSKSSSLQYKRPSFPSFKPPLRVSVPSNGVSPSAALLQLKQNSAPSASASLTLNPTDGSNPFFHGAIGNLDVPQSIRTVLRPHQIDGVTFMWNCLTTGTRGKPCSQRVQGSPMDADDGIGTNGSHAGRGRRGCILSDEMGLGKTLMTIATITSLHRQKRDMRFVVVCPSSLVKNWGQEFTKWLGNASQPRRVVVHSGGAQAVQQIKAFAALKPNLSEVLIVSYDLFRRNASLFSDIQKVALLVVDEGHRLKNTSGSLTMTALESVRCDARLCITATPVQNNLSDLYTMVNFACPGLLGDLSTFRRDFERPLAACSNKDCSSEDRRNGTKQSQLLDEIVGQVMLRRLQKDVLDKILPPKTMFLLFCRPTKEQCILYKQIAKRHRGVRSEAAGADASPDSLTALMGLRKVCAHPRLFTQGDGSDMRGNKRDINILSSGKMMVLNALLDAIRESEPTDKVVIVSNFTSTLTVVEDAILKPKQLTYLRLDGSTTSTNRQSLVDTFNRTSSERTFALTLSSKAGGVGLNLIGANRLIMVDPDWNPATDIQAMARIHRSGQKKPCYIYRLFTSGTVEEIICQRQIQKGSLATLAVDSVEKSKASAAKLSCEELEDCFTIKESCRCDTHEKIGDWPDYLGEEGLISLGCSDEALLSIAAMDEAACPLVFVHAVNDEGQDSVDVAEYMDGENRNFDDSEELPKKHGADPASNDGVEDNNYNSDDCEEHEFQ